MDRADESINPYLKVPDLARIYSVSVITIWKWSRSGKLPPPTRFGRSLRWNRSAIEAHIADAERRGGAA